MSAPVGVLSTLELPDEDAFTKMLAARVDRVSTELLDEIWGADFGDPPGSGTVRQLLARLGKELKVTHGDLSLEVRGVTTWELFRELGRTVAAIAWVAHDAGGHGTLDFESKAPARAARIDVGRWRPTEPEPNLLVRLSPPAVPASDASLVTAIEAVRLGTADDAALVTLLDAVAPKSVDGGYFPHSQAVRLAVEALVASRDPRIEPLAVARIPRVIDPGHGPKALLTADLVRVLAARGTDTAKRKIVSIGGRAKPPARRPAGPVHLACEAALGRSVAWSTSGHPPSVSGRPGSQRRWKARPIARPSRSTTGRATPPCSTRSSSPHLAWCRAAAVRSLPGRPSTAAPRSSTREARSATLAARSTTRAAPHPPPEDAMSAPGPARARHEAVPRSSLDSRSAACSRADAVHASPPSFAEMPRERRLTWAAFVAGAAVPAYFILLEFEEGRVSSILDFRYVPYIAAEAALELLDA